MSSKKTEEELYFEPVLQDDMHLQAEALLYTMFSDERCDTVCKKNLALKHTVLHSPCTAETPGVPTVPLKSRRSRVCVLFSTWQCWYFTREAARLGQGCQSAQPPSPSTFHSVLMHPFKGLAQGPAPTRASTIPLWLREAPVQVNRPLQAIWQPTSATKGNKSICQPDRETCSKQGMT